MVNNKVFVEEFNEPEINKKEVLRYFGAKEWNKETEELFNDCVKESKGKLSYKTCYAKFLLNDNNDVLSFADVEIKSGDLKKNLKGCREVIVFGATIGTGMDFLIGKYGKISPVKALMFQALGAERTESLCNEFCRYLNFCGIGLRPRFSPGYGDFSLEHQKDIFRILDCPRKIGLTLNESLLMSPTKSVTAIAGISDECVQNSSHSCKLCSKTDCIFRRVD